MTAHEDSILSKDISAEHRLLIAAARLALDDQSKAELLARLGGQLNWEAVIEEARWHKLEGLLFSHLRQEPFATKVPAASLTTLKGLYSRNVARYMYYRTELNRILELLGQRGVPVAVLKGAELVETIYRDPGLRPMVDLDLLVPRERSAEAYAAVQQMGYRPVVGAEEQSRMDKRDRQLAALAGIGKPVIVEVHTHIVEVDNPMRLDIGAFWSETQPQNIAGRPALTLKPEAEIAYLSYNFFKDRRYYSYSALGQLCDLAEVCRSAAGKVRWEAFLPGEKFGELAGPVFCGLYLARNVLGAPVPEPALRNLQPRRFQPAQARLLLLQRVLNKEFMAKQLVQPDRPRYGLAAALAGAIRRTVPTRDYISHRYNIPAGSKRIYLYYPRRMAEGLWVGLSMLLRPRRLSDELAVDRWLYDLHHAGSPPKKTNVIPSMSGTEAAQQTAGGRG